MLTLCTAEDGHIVEVDATLRDIENGGTLESFLQQHTGVDEEAIIAYLSDGRRIRSDNVRELAGSQDQSIYVFNKSFFEYDLDEVLHELHMEAPLQPSIEDEISATPPYRASQVAAAYAHTATAHKEHVDQILESLRYQHDALRIACGSLELNVLAIADAFEGIASTARKELDKQAKLLAGLDVDLDIISRVGIHADFMSPSVRKAIGAGEKRRTLGDYVSDVKMRQVGETCARTHEDLQSKFAQTEDLVFTVTEGTEIARAAVSVSSFLEEADSSCRRAHELYTKIATDSEIPISEMKKHDTALRHEVQTITDTKNSYTAHCIDVLRKISVLNKDLVQLPASLSTLQTSFRAKTSFSHIQRLHNMLYAYGATVIEVVRRKEFARFFNHRAQSILEVMAKLSASEKKRRQLYRGEVHGQLPFDTKGMDDTVPTIDFSPTHSFDAAYSLERQDVDALMHILEDLENLAQSSTDAIALSAVHESRDALGKLVAKMDSLESGFDRIAERSLLSASRLTTSRRRTSTDDDHAFQEVVEQLRESQRTQAALEAERISLLDEIESLKAHLVGSGTNEQDQATQLAQELEDAHRHLEHESTAHRMVKERYTDLEQSHREVLSDVEALREELAQAQRESDELRVLETRSSEKLAELLEEQSRNLRNLEEARLRGDDLEIQIQHVRTESEDVHRTLRESIRDKDRLLRTQAAEHDRRVRDHIAEADGDRAVLEHQFSELQAVHEESERQSKDLRAQVDEANADAVGLREELQRVERELRDVREAERVLRDDLRAGQASQSDFEQQLENSSRLVAQFVDVAVTFSNSHVKALNAAHAMSTHAGSGLRPNLADSIVSNSGIYHSNIEPAHIDPSDPAAALDILRAFDHDQFLETLGKTGLQIKKWQKQCKEYRERAKSKISFRNFAKGDLALFLPTRNSVSKPWAAFNVSFPHYFLQATGHLSEQLKTREWIVARITSITERITDHRDPTSNPYGLGDGVKYYFLEVEDWTQPSSQKRRVSRRAATDPEVLTPPPPAIPDAEVESSFQVTHPPSSQLFPIRDRSNSSSKNGRPSSLSQVLAQAPAESAAEAIPAAVPTLPPVVPSPMPLPSPVVQVGSLPRPLPSPLRPGSRASRLSTSSKMSIGRGTLAGSPGKASATTALTEEAVLLSSSPSSTVDSDRRVDTPSPAASFSEDMSNLLMSHHRRRTSSYHSPRTSPLAATSNVDSMEARPHSRAARPGMTASGTLASLASSWGVSFGRRRRGELGNTSEALDNQAAESDGIEDGNPLW